MTFANLVLLSAATLLFSLVGLVAKVVSLPSATLTFGRALFAVAAVLILAILSRNNLFRLRSRADLWPLLVCGLFMSGNWFFYIAAIKVSTVSVAVIALFTYPFITSLLEPLFFREPYKPSAVFGGVCVFAGVMLIVPRFELSDTTVQGVMLGVLSALSFSFRNIFSRKMVARYTGIQVMSYQFLVALVLFAPALFLENASWSIRDVGYLALLGGVLTTFSLVLFTSALKRLSSAIASVFLLLQPVVTIILAFLLLHETPTARTVIGGAIVSATVITVSVLHAFKAPQ